MPLFSKKQSIFVLRGLIEALPLVLVLFSPVLGAKVGQPLILSLIVYAGLNRHNLKMPDRNGWLFLLLITQYLVFHMFLAIAGGENTEARQYVSTAGLWAQPLLGLPLMFVYATTYAGIRQTFRFIAPPATALNMLVIGVAYFLGDVCRVRISGEIFLPALLMANTVFLWIALFGKETPRDRFIGAGMLVLCLVTSTAFLGVRGIFLSELAVIFLMLGYLLLHDRNLAISLGFTVVVGIGLAFAIDQLAGCNFFLRSTNIVVAPDEMMTSDRSAGLRLVMWENAWDLIQTNPIFGHGIISEVAAAEGQHIHVHNMYLSWLIWGGVFSLASGILCLLAIAAAFAFGKMSNRLFFGAVAVCVPWGLSMVFDSFLVWPTFLTSFVVISSVGYGLLTSRE